jgi:hypothetical protein
MHGAGGHEERACAAVRLLQAGSEGLHEVADAGFVAQEWAQRAAFGGIRE